MISRKPRLLICIGLSQPTQLTLLPVHLLGQKRVHARALLGRHPFADEAHGSFLSGVHGFRCHALDDADAGNDDASLAHLLG